MSEPMTNLAMSYFKTALIMQVVDGGIVVGLFVSLIGVIIFGVNLARG